MVKSCRMSLSTTRKLMPITLGAFLLSSHGSAPAQTADDAPAAYLPGSCKGVEFNRASLSAPVRLDLLISVDETGKAVSSKPLKDVSNPALLSAVQAAVLTCKFQAALVSGNAAPGSARMLYQIGPPPAAVPLARKPTITDVKGCAPSAADYPDASRRLSETGTTKISFTVNPEGQLTAFGVLRTSGYLRLDFTALMKLASCKFQPGTTADGTPTSATFEVDYVWKLE